MFEGLFQPLHLIIIFAIVLLVFGPRKLPEIGKGLGESIRGFKKAISEDPDDRPSRSEETKKLEDKRPADETKKLEDRKPSRVEED